ncbi:MAG: MlaD family protein [Candidatus Omnitrophota bacterium]
MTFGKSKLELKVGIFVFIGIVILVMFVLFIGDFKNVFSTYKINFSFSFINGVKIGAPVRFAGVDIGDIREVNLVPAGEGKNALVRLVGWVKQDVKIPADSAVWVNTLGLLGEKYIEIMPGKDLVNFVPYDGELIGNDPMAMQEVGELTKSVVIKLDDTLVSIKGLSKHIDEGLEKIKLQEGSLGKLIYGDKIYADLEALVSDIKAHPWKLFWKGKENKKNK